MNDEGRLENQDALAQAHETIARQAQEIERLRRRVADERDAEQLREALRLAATAGAIATPVTHSRLLEMIVETAAHVINARAGSLFLVDEETEELVFEVALGPKAHEVRKFRVPLGHGIAGLVAVSGQPMAISDAQSDPRHAAEIGRSIGYVPQSILCVPLFYNDQVIGVLELLDKDGATSFSPRDMEALGLFANQAAVAIEQSRLQRNVGALITAALESLDTIPGAQRRDLQQRARAFTAGVEEDAVYRRALDLATLIQEVGREGETELHACHAIVHSFAAYLRTRRRGAENVGAMV